MSEKRLAKFREQFQRLGIDGALVYKDENRNYLTGFTGDESFALITTDKSYFITDSRYIEQAHKEVEGFEVLEYTFSIYDFIAELVASNGVKNLGIEEDYMTYEDYEAYKSRLNGVTIKPLDKSILKLRMIKDENEVNYIQKAAEIADDAFEHMLKFIKPGMTELEVGLELEFFMRRKGASGLSFPSIVASGKRSSLPHGTATEKILEDGDFLTLDYGCIYKGYCSDMTRTIAIGKASEKQKEIYNIVLEAQEKALEAVKPGVKCFDIDKIGRDIITKAGYGDRFGHGLGHGVGLEIHELPGVNRRGTEILAPGMIITDEPGIYIPDFGGVRIEDLILVTEDGCKVLSKSPKHLIEL